MTSSHSRRLDLEERPDLGQAGVVDEAVETTEPLDHPADQLLGLSTIADVRGEALRLGAQVADPFQRPRRALGRAVVMDGDDRPLLGGLDGDLRPDSLAAAGDEDDSAGERVAHHAAGTARGGAVDSRRMTAVGSNTGSGSSPASSRSACSNPRRPISRSGNRTVERLGAVRAAVEMSSNPATDTSRGTATPSSARRWSAPIASRSFAQAIAVNGVPAERSDVDAERAALAIERRVDDEPVVEGDPRLREAAPIAGQALAGDEERPRPGEERDPAMAEPDERRDHRRRFPRRCRRGPPVHRVRAARGGRPRRRRPASPRGAGSISSFASGSSRPLPANTIAAARIERSSRTYERSRSGIPLGAAGDHEVARRGRRRPRRPGRLPRSTGP